MMLERIRSSHIGINGCVRRPKDSLSWPEMTAAMKDKVHTCEPCRQYGQKYQKEISLPHGIPQRPWVKVAANLFTCYE